MKSGESGDYFLLFAHNPAPYRVLASLENLEAASAETEFVAGANSVDLTLRDTLRISGTLSGPDGQPRRGVKVEAVSAGGAVAAFSVSDAKGKFILRRLPDGEFKLRAAGVGTGRREGLRGERGRAALRFEAHPSRRRRAGASAGGESRARARWQWRASRAAGGDVWQPAGDDDRSVGALWLAQGPAAVFQLRFHVQ